MGLHEGAGGMVIITDGCGPMCLHAYVSRTPESMDEFVVSTPPKVREHPPIKAAEGVWANVQIAFFPDKGGDVVSVGYTLWQGNRVKSQQKPAAFGMTMTVFALRNVTVLV